MTRLPDSDSVPLPPKSLDRSSAWRSNELAWTAAAGLCLLLALFPVVAILGYVVAQGWQRLDWVALTQLPPAPLVEGGGFGNAIVGTVLMVGIGTLLSVPVGVAAAIYVAEFSPPEIAQYIRFGTNILSGVPSIIFGVFVYGWLVLTTGGFSALAGGVALAVLMLPLILRASDEALQLVAPELRWAAMGLGASHLQMILHIVLPAAQPAIATGVMLAIARAAGETAPLLFTALSSDGWSNGLMQPRASLAVLIYHFALTPYPNQQALAWTAALVLVMLVLIVNITARRIVRPPTR